MSNNQPFDDFAAFAASFNKPARLAGLDLGTKTIGVALCDAGWRFATASHTIKRSKFQSDAAELIALFEAEEIGGVVLGLPLNMDGSSGPRVQSTKAFARNMAKIIAIPIAYWDERLSTWAAERTMLEADLSRKKRSERIDAAAAAHILQGAIDRLTAIQTDQQ